MMEMEYIQKDNRDVSKVFTSSASATHLATVPFGVRPRSLSDGTALQQTPRNKKEDGSRTKKAPATSNRYKTELCRPFQEYGYCKYSDKCQFAHGVIELRCLPRHPKYKTELCRTYHTRGFCPYGPRCHFIHNLDEARRPPPILTRSSSASTPTFPSSHLQLHPPLSPSQDSGISSPASDDTASFFVGGKPAFEFPLSDNSCSSDEADSDTSRRSKLGSTSTLGSFFPEDTLNGNQTPASPEEASHEVFADIDSLSSGSASPTKSVNNGLSSGAEGDLSEKVSSISLDDGMTSRSHGRLPIFDALNSRSDTALGWV